MEVQEPTVSKNVTKAKNGRELLGILRLLIICVIKEVLHTKLSLLKIVPKALGSRSLPYVLLLLVFA